MDNNILTKVVNDIDRAAQERFAYKVRRVLAGERFNLSEALADSLAGCIAADYLFGRRPQLNELPLDESVLSGSDFDSWYKSIYQGLGDCLDSAAESAGKGAYYSQIRIEAELLKTLVGSSVVDNFSPPTSCPTAGLVGYMI